MDSLKLKIRCLVIEYMHRLKCCNVYIRFNHQLEEHQTKVSLKATEIQIRTNDEVHIVNTSKFFLVNLDSFCNLRVQDDCMSFRMLVADEQFKSEVIELTDASIEYQKIQPTLKNEETSLTITCSNCSSQLTVEKEVIIRRVLELPSSKCDVSDWFCHRHSNEELFHTDGSSCFNEKTQQFQPKTMDIFYSPFSLLVNQALFDQSRLRRKKETIYCKRCLQLLGYGSSSSIRFWWECIKFGRELFYPYENPVDLIIGVIRNHLAGLTFLSPIVKIIFEASVPNEGRKIHILIQVMDKSLQLFRLNLKTFELEKRPSIKIMYLKLSEQTDDNERALKYWQKDINITTFELSCKMFHKFCEYLLDQSRFIPESYRSNNSFQLSYIEFM